MTSPSVGVGVGVDEEMESTLVFCIFCRREVKPDPDSDTDYAEHLCK